MLIRMVRHARRIAIGLCVAGCTNVNQPLNDDTVPLYSRRHNTTRSAVAADIASPIARAEETIRPRTGPQPATQPQASGETRESDGVFVGLALSGGGSRSANFSAACMFELEEFGLLDRVDYISSVSGGSITAAYYCLNDADWNPGNLQRKLAHPFANDLLVQTLLPWNLIALSISDYDRSDLLAASFNAVLFSRNGRPLTFADLRKDRPRLLLNCTDLQSGHRFIFCNETFDELNSDLSKYPIAHAVAASAAVPVLLHQVTLRDFSTSFRQYRHLIDGGVTDNLGVQSLVDTYAAHLRTAKESGRPDPYPNGAMLFIVDAHTQFDAKLSDKGDFGLIESLAAGAGLTSTALLNRVSSATLAEIIVKNSADPVTAKAIRRQIRALNEDGYLELKDEGGHTVRVVLLSLEQVNGLTNVPFQSFHESVNSIATYFNIGATEAYNLYEAAHLLVKEKFEKRLVQMNAELRRAAEQPASAP